MKNFSELPRQKGEKTPYIGEAKRRRSKEAMKENIRKYVSEKTVRLLRGAGFYGYDSYKDVPLPGS